MFINKFCLVGNTHTAKCLKMSRFLKVYQIPNVHPNEQSKLSRPLLFKLDPSSFVQFYNMRNLNSLTTVTLIIEKSAKGPTGMMVKSLIFATFGSPAIKV